MRASVIVLSTPDYQRWLQTGLAFSPISGAGRGAKLFYQLGCVSCHGDNSSVQAPRLEDLYGSLVPLTDGQSVRADENYFRESIFNPNAKIVSGFAAIMPTYAGQIDEEDVLDLIAFIKTLHRDRAEGEAKPEARTEMRDAYDH
jgi:cytochrome c oxidase subunit 2